ncbi:LPXTG-motif cell wall-anchored protein, partial [Terracoccus luteus]|nr:LPXTG-motif cell wall-anchored protein [Terracoccus luteus]MCP2174032.1 LPXTG-motif cell wall-anchored protein [Terracoccus luteus]
GQTGANTGMLALGGGLLLAAAGTGAFAAKRRNTARAGA